jgi:hypothetical protein
MLVKQVLLDGEVQPGRRLYAFEDFDRDVWDSPELAAMFASKSVAFELHEGENRQVRLR